MRFSFHTEALAEYREATRYYSKQARGLGQSFTAEVEAAIRATLVSPRARAASAHGTRRYLLRRFPYGIHYAIEQLSTESQEE